ncbi:MAG: AMP-binding protein [Acidimicrobiia bacterium]
MAGLWEIAATEPGRPAVLQDDGPVSYAELVGNARRVANALKDAGIGPGDIVGVVLPNQLATVEVILAVQESGIRMVPISFHLVADEVAYLLEDSGAKGLIVDARHAEGVTGALARIAGGPTVRFSVRGLIDGFTPLEEAKAAASDAPPEPRVMGGPMFYTSGTTGRPKAVYRAMASFPPDLAALGGIAYASRFELEPGHDVHLVSCPLYHAAPSGWGMNALHLGHAIVVPERWTAQGALDAIARFGVNNTFMVPTQFHRLLELPDDVRAAADTSSLKTVVHAAAPCPIGVKQRMLDWWGPVIWEFYAGTEGGGTTARPEDWLAKPGTVGTAWEGTSVHVLDDDGNEAPPGEAGSIYFGTGEPIAFEYKGDPEKTANSRRGNLFSLGDIGYKDEDGSLFLLDRRTDLIITGGVNVYPAEIESVLSSHPKVADAAVFGLPDDDWGQHVCAVVQPAPGIDGDDELRAELLAECTAKLAKLKVPKRLDFRDSLPRRDNGKLYKRVLRDEYLAAG